MSDSLILGLGLFVLIPAAVGWAVAIAGLWSWWMDRRHANDYNAMVGNLGRHYTPAQRKTILRAVVK